MSNAFNLSQLANNINTSGQISMTAGVTGTLPIANGGTNSTATPTAGGATYGTGTALAITAAGTTGQALVSAGASAPAFGTLPIAGGGTNNASLAVTAGGVVYTDGTKLVNVGAGTSGQVLTSAGASAPTWATASGGGNPAGTIILYGGTTAPTGYLICPTSATTVSRSTYAALFTAIGTTWGAGDGSTTFGLPWFAANYAAVQASSNVGTATTGAVIAHNHAIYGICGDNAGCGRTLRANTATQTDVSGTTGGTANLAAGARVLHCIKF